MEGSLFVKSDSVIIEDGRLLTAEGDLLGGYVVEGEDLEETCVKKAKEKNIDIEIIKPLSPRIKWGADENGKKIIMVNINYLSKLKNKSEKWKENL